MGVDDIGHLKDGDEEQPKEELGTIADDAEIPESEEEITQSEDPIDPDEAAEEEA